MHAKIYDRTVKPVVFGLWIKPQTNGFHEFVFVLYFVAIGSFTADGGLLQPTVWCKDNTSKDPFSQCELYKEVAYRSKLSKRLQRQELKLTTGSTERNPTMCEVTWNTWWTRESERSWCQCMSLHALKILRFRSLSFCCQLVSLSFDCLPW